MFSKFIKNLSLRKKMLFSYIIVIIFCMTFFSFVTYQNSSKSIQDETRQTVLQTVNLAKEYTLSYMNDIENTLFAVQQNKKIQSILTEEHNTPYDEINMLETELLTVDVFRKKLSTISLYVLNRPQYPQAYNASMVFSGEIAKNEPWYLQTIEKNGETLWSVFHVLDSTGIISASRLILDMQTHTPVAVLRADIDIIPFTNYMDKIQLGPSGKVFLVSENHIINLNGNNFIKNFVNNQEFLASIQSESPSDSYVEINGSRYLISYENIKGTRLKIVGAVDCATLDVRNKFAAKAIFTTAIISMLIAFLLLFMFSAWITVPIINLTNIMKNFGNDLRGPVQIPSNDEIGTLYKSYNSMISTIDNLINDVNILFQKQKFLELKALQAQINPHFLYNTLDSINWMAKKYRADDISKMVKALASFFRHSLNKGQEYTTIENELKQIISYVEIQKVRFKEKFDLNINVDENILPYSIVNLTLQPLVENCIVHAFEDIDYKGIILIDGYLSDDYILIKVTDNGIGYNTDELNRLISKEFSINEPIEKYGLHNVNQRLKLYFDNTCGLHFEQNETKGISAIIKIGAKKL